MRILVTGGFGFQGAHIVRALLQRGDTVTVLSTPSVRNRIAFHEMGDWIRARTIHPLMLTGYFGSVADAEILEKALPGHDAVIHLAAWASVDASLERPWPPFEINAQGTYALLEACRRFGDKGLRILIASSCEVYGPTQESEQLDTSDDPGSIAGDILSQDEDWPMMPRSPYAASKVAADRFAYAHAVTYGMDVTILRPCNIFGPGQYAGAMGAVIPKFTKAALTGQPLQITGTGEQFREFLYVEDLVTAYLAALDAPAGLPGATYNVGSGETRTVKTLAESICYLVGSGAVESWDGLIQHIPARVADVSGFLLDSSAFRARFGWKPARDFGAGLTVYVRWAQQRHVKGEAI